MLGRLEFVRADQAVGLTLGEIREVIAGSAGRCAVVCAAPGCPSRRSTFGPTATPPPSSDRWRAANETVPTVVVGSSFMVNPSARAVLDTLRAEAPGLLPPSQPRAKRRFPWWRTG
jgi:hypothetical protein